MKVDQLVVFWRDDQVRCFTSWHFLAGKGERAHHRARQMLTLLEQFTTLQIYGAALNSEMLPLDHAKPAPVRGTDMRLQVTLYPNQPINPRAGINYIKFSIPGPSQELIDIVESKRFRHSRWLLLEKEIWRYLCLPDGTKIKSSGERLYRAEINYLDLEHRPQPNHPPLQAAIARTTEDLQIARSSLQKIDTPRERRRVEKYQARLDDLYTWQYLEKNCFDAIESLPLVSLNEQLPASAPPAHSQAPLAVEALPALPANPPSK